MSPSRARRVAGVLSVWLLPFAASADVEPVLLHDAAGGVAELRGQHRLVVAGVRGTLFLRLGKPGEVRYAARSLDNRREDRRIALWLDNGTMRFAPSAGMEEEPLLLEAAIPPELSVEITAWDSHLTLTGLKGDLKVVGGRLELEVRNLGQSVDFEISDSRLTLSDVENQVGLEGRALRAELSRVRGDLSVSATESEIELQQIDGEVDVDLTDSSLTAGFLRRRVQVVADGGEVTLRDLQQGGELRLDGTPLELARVLGKVEVETDAATRFHELDCELVVRGYGSSVSGSGNLRSVQVTTHSAEVRVDNLGGSLRIEGDHLRIQASGIKGETTVVTTSSDVELSDTSGLVQVQNQYGDVSISKATKKVTVSSQDGDIRIDGLSAPLQLTANGNRVEVGWSDVPGDGDSLVQNDGGEVRIRLPLKWVGTVEAETDFGRIESNIAGVAVTDAGNRAVGVVRRRATPRLKVVSGGDVYLSSSVPVRDE